MRYLGDGRMEELILKDMEDIIKKLEKIPWFENCQQNNVVSKFDISYCKNLNSCIKHCSSTRWQNLVLEKREDVRTYIAYSITSKYKWNDIIAVIKKRILPELLNYVESKWNYRFEKNNIVKIKLETILINFLALYLLSEYKEEPFHDELLKIYEQGYFPCGWKGTYPEGKIIIF